MSRWAPEPEVTSSTDIITPFGTVRLAWQEENVTKVQMAPFDFDPQRRTTIRRYMPPHENGQRMIAKMMSYFQGKEVDFEFTFPENMGTSFQRRVWMALKEIPYGSHETYGDLALRLDLPLQSARSVGNACGQNPLPIIFPCHRVIASTGQLTGYSAGVAWKKALLELEGVSIENDKIRTFRK